MNHPTLPKATANDFDIVHADDPRWDDYVRAHPSGSIFHTSGMMRAFGVTPDMQPFARAAVDGDGNIIALLTSVHITTVRSLPALGARAVQFAEPLCEPTPAGITALTHLLRIHDDHMRTKSLFCEVRPHHRASIERDPLESSGYELQDYINYIVHLDSDPQVCWRGIKKRMRQKISSTFRKGIVVVDDTSHDGIERLYPLLQQSYCRACVPLVRKDLFHAVLTELPNDVVRIQTAFAGNEAVASIISLVFGGRVFSWYGGTQRLAARSPFACIVWEDIKWGCETGQQFFDFGGGGWPGKDYGPRKFKREFGGEEVRFGRYQITYSKLRRRLAELAYESSRRWGAWSRNNAQKG